MSDAPYELPMFPLGSNVFPTQVLPLQIFEPRYLELIDVVLATESRSFGVVLIERGWEVGGGDVRSDVATRVEVLQAEQVPDGRWAVVGAGVERLTVIEWLDDDPFPRALVAPRDRVDDGGAPLGELEDLLAETLGIGARLVGAEPPDLDQLASDPINRLDQMSAVAPLTPFDRQGILEAGSTSIQIERLRSALEDKLILLRSEADQRGSD